jgi:hypothetical protein
MKKTTNLIQRLWELLAMKSPENVQLIKIKVESKHRFDEKKYERN